VVCHRLLIAGAWVQSQNIPCEICGGRNSAEAWFSLMFTLSFHRPTYLSSVAVQYAHLRLQYQGTLSDASSPRANRNIRKALKLVVQLFNLKVLIPALKNFV
jgi:hypothetical protein